MESTMDQDRHEAELHRMRAETLKLRMESRKLLAEGRKYQRETLFYPFVAGAGVLGAAIALVKLFMH